MIVYGCKSDIISYRKDIGKGIKTMRAVVTVVGHDQKGIIAKTSTILFENDVNILDISQTIMQDLFTMIMLVEYDGDKQTVKTLNEKLDELSKETGLSIRLQREEIFSSMHRI